MAMSLGFFSIMGRTGKLPAPPRAGKGTRRGCAGAAVTCARSPMPSRFAQAGTTTNAAGSAGMQRLFRRVAVAAVIGTALGVAGAARAQDDYPNHAVRWLVGYPPGGSTDICARLIGQYLSEHLGQQFDIENKPGAGNNLATEMATKADPDGYTVFLVNPANAINATLYKNLTFDFIRDMAPVAGIIRVPNVMEVNPNVPAKTVAEFIAYAKANAGKVNMASAGVGTSVHLSGALFMM